ncbi:MAG: hypothetical protein HC800_25330, partial [Phormidesmis sp. RL_2_1]|nr:hypothetical protein [Phormidesmis sp. RL_2_1]
SSGLDSECWLSIPTSSQGTQAFAKDYVEAVRAGRSMDTICPKAAEQKAEPLPVPPDWLESEAIEPIGTAIISTN